MSDADIHQRLFQHHQQLLEKTLLTEANLFPQIYRHYLEYRSQLDGDPDEARRLRLDRLDAQLRHAASQVPAYRGLDPDAPLASWTFTGKADLRDRLADLCDDAIDGSRCRSATTSGTTGIPVRLVHDFDHIAHKYALSLRRNDAAGLPMRRRILMPMRDGGLPWSEYASPAHGNSIVAQFGSVTHDRATDDIMRRAGWFEPDIVYGHPSNCLRFVEALAAAGVTVRPRLVLTYGEPLGDGAREQLETGLEAPVRDGYGMREFGTIAVQCAQGSYHVESERLLVEIVDPRGCALPPGEHGEVVVTDLVNRAMPLVRYRTGDSARLAAAGCACGYPGDVLSGIEGRDLGTISLGGVDVPVNAVTRVVRRHPLRRFQIVHPAAEALDVLVSVRGDRPALLVMRRLGADLREFLGRDVRLTVRAVSDDGEYLPSRSGKDTDYVSLV